MEYWEMHIWKVNELNFLNEVAKKSTNRWCQNFVNVRNPSYLNQKLWILFMRHKQIIYSVKVYIYIYIILREENGAK